MQKVKWVLEVFLAAVLLAPLPALCAEVSAARSPVLLPKIRVAADHRSFETPDARPFVPMGINYFRPGTGWAPQLWKQFDAEATRRDFGRMKELGVNCVRVFLTYGSFYTEPGQLAPEGIEKLDQFLAMAEEHDIYVHPTGPDHWEGIPDWAHGDRIAGERALTALEDFWRLLAGRYRGRSVIFSYDLLNEPQVAWNTRPLRDKWNRWLEKKYQSPAKVTEAWGASTAVLEFGSIPVPEPNDAPGDLRLLEYQHFRETVADEWTRRQTAAIQSADPEALVTVGFIQWSVPSLLGRPSQYSAFRPDRQAAYLDFLEVHFYPLDHGAYEYQGDESEAKNLAYLEGVVREVARPGKPVVIAEFGWYGGGKPTFDRGRHPAATEDQQARWCRRVVEGTAGLAVGWLNWGLYDTPEARDVSQLTGLLTTEGTVKTWGHEFRRLAGRYAGQRIPARELGWRPALEWDACVTSSQAGHEFRQRYYEAFSRRP